MPHPTYPTYSIADIVARTGAKERPVLLWADARAIWAEPGTDRAGRGVHRKFPWREVQIAAVLAAAAPFRLPIGVMVDLGSSVRTGLMLEGFPHGAMQRMAAAFQAAQYGEGDAVLVLVPGDTPQDKPFNYFVRWPGEAGVPGSRHKTELVIDLAEIWRGLRP